MRRVSQRSEKRFFMGTLPSVARLSVGMDHELTRVLAGPLADAEKKVTDALKAEGFGVLTRIDLQATLKEKLGAELAPYVILGACNPPFAQRAVSLELAAGLMLPCNVIVHAEGERIRVRAVDPRESVKPFHSSALAALAEEVRAKLAKVVARL